MAARLCFLKLQWSEPLDQNWIKLDLSELDQDNWVRLDGSMLDLIRNGSDFVRLARSIRTGSERMDRTGIVRAVSELNWSDRYVCICMYVRMYIHVYVYVYMYMYNM